MRAERQQARFAELDTNNDGNLTIEEFNAAPMAAFDNQDRDGDGAISRQEALERRFQMLDADGNGLLSAAEMQNRAPLRPRQGGERAERGEQMNRQQREQMRERMENMSQQQRDQMRERMQNMTPEQRARMREQMQERRGGQGQGQGQGHSPDHGQGRGSQSNQ